MGRVAVAVVALVWLVACGDDEGVYVGPFGGVVGGPCAGHVDCAPGAQCERGGDFPDGHCTLPCDLQFDCPLGTACVDKEGGICLVGCGSDAHCRGGYECKKKDLKEADGDARVCIK